MARRGEVYVIFDEEKMGDKYFYYSVEDKESHTKGIVKCNKKYNLSLDVLDDEISYTACEKMAAFGHLTLLVEDDVLIGFVPFDVTDYQYDFCKANNNFFRRHYISVTSLYEDDGKIIKKEIEGSPLMYEDGITRAKTYKNFMKELKLKRKGKENNKREDDVNVR